MTKIIKIYSIVHNNKKVRKDRDYEKNNFYNNNVYGVVRCNTAVSINACICRNNLGLTVNGKSRQRRGKRRALCRTSCGCSVILNRVKHSSFPNTVAGVIYQPGAFTAVSDGQINAAISSNSTVYKACQDAMNGWDPSGGAIYYFNPDTATNAWIWSRELIVKIGKHRFCR